MGNFKNTVFLLFAVLLLSLAPRQLAGQSVDDIDSLVDRLLLNLDVNTPAYRELNVKISEILHKLPLADVDSAILRKVATTKLDALDLARLFTFRAYLYFEDDRSAEAISISKAALKFAEQSGNEREIGLTHLHLGNYYRTLGFNSYSADQLQLSGEILSKKYPIDAAVSFYEAAVTSYRVGNIRRSLEEQRQSLRQFKRVSRENMDGVLNFYLMSGWNTMGLNYQKLKQYDSAIISYVKADSVARVEIEIKFWKDKFWVAMLQANIGSVYLDMGKPEQALPFFRQDYEMMLAIDSKQALNVRLYNVRAHLQLKKIRDALSLTNKITDSYSMKNADYWKVKAQVQQAANDLPEALHSLHKLVALEDSIRRAAEAGNLSALKTIYDVGALDENIRKLTDQKNQKQSTIQIQIVAFSLSFIMLSAVAFAYYRFNRKSKIQLDIIREQREEMTQQNDMLKEALDKLHETQKQLIESAKMSSLGQMTAGLAHEINNPLNYISGGVQALDQTISHLVSISTSREKNRAQQIQNDIHGMLRSIHNGVGRASRIVQSLRTFSGKQSEFGAVNISDPVEMAIDILYGRIKDAGVVLRRNYAPDIPPITGNLSELNQVFSNLIDNALYAMEASDKKELTIETDVVGNSVVVRIRDTGIGIPEELHDKIIEPFFTTKETGKGTGLGLSISYSIIKKHQGEIVFVSSGKGTCFTISFPAKGI